ncbi:MAG: hypothetical protein H7A45_17160 [Verrucomicrobiales bacterium]|nr:hypothetical protein [Verrucomicrobiales bacterium]MCP5525619.1 hypothetical protein [Verrucomicrobiales bacterium]
MSDTSHHFAPERQIKAQAKQALAAAKAADSSITIFSEFGVSLVLTYGISTSGINIGLELDTPVGDVSLGNVTLSPTHPSASLGGHIGPFEAKLTASYDVSANSLTISGELKLPIVGTKKFSKTIPL